MYVPIAKRSRLVSAKLTSTDKNNYPFLNVPDLAQDNIRVYGIEVFSSDQLTTDPNGLTVVSAAALKGLTLTLVSGTKKSIIDLPLKDLVRSENGGFIFALDNIPITLTSCYVTIQNSTGISANQVAVFNLLYTFK